MKTACNNGYIVSTLRDATTSYTKPLAFIGIKKKKYR